MDLLRMSKLVLVFLGGALLWPGGWVAAGGKIAKSFEPDITAEDRAHWAFKKPVRPHAPLVAKPDLVNNPVDAFILARLEKAGLSLAPVLDRPTLLRRLTFDLTGLPPTPLQVREFVRDIRADALGRVIERLLASPHHGERWAQHWLDLVRFAETNGYEADGERPHAWRYRDYVIGAFNEDRPYNRFVLEQLAGDEMATGKNPREAASLLIACGFNRCGPVHLVTGNVDLESNRQEVLTEMTGAVGSTFLGLTIGCARCHNHKFDPFSLADYYRLQAFFAAAQPVEIDIAGPAEEGEYRRKQKNIQARLGPLRQQIARLDDPVSQRLTAAKKARLDKHYRDALAQPAKQRTAEQKKWAAEAEILIKVPWDEIVGALAPADRARRTGLRARIHALEAQLPPPPSRAWTIQSDKKIPGTFVLKRGDPKNKGMEVQPALPRVLRQASTTSGRLDRVALARWLTQPDHPLTARVMVNRIWQHHFGRGLVASPNDFGLRGELPSHPELLDWLACEFVEHGWSVKHIHRLILLSRTYQQTGRVGPARAQRLDPENRLLWRGRRQRLQGEALRDSVLAVAGTLNPKMGGPMVRLPLEPEIYELIFTEGEPDGLWPVTPDRREHQRRSIYLFTKRNVRLPFLEAFDKPDTLTSCPVRPVSTFAPQALIMLNGDFVQEQSRKFATRLVREVGAGSAQQVNRAYKLALGRAPRAVERKIVREFLLSQAGLLRDRLKARKGTHPPEEIPQGVDTAAWAALVDFCLALLNCNEFVYVN
jgi:hypothetical protein